MVILCWMNPKDRIAREFLGDLARRLSLLGYDVETHLRKHTVCITARLVVEDKRAGVEERIPRSEIENDPLGPLGAAECYAQRIHETMPEPE